ncbi:MAG: Crp/Fnr family transcriptional regulator [Coriobacteriia bacterium]|nr:Crp/Fnr family transcriptional regulator [Coriobacteriia bacterium]
MAKQSVYEPFEQVFESSALFADISRDEIPSLLTCLDGRLKTCTEGRYILMAGEAAKGVGLLLSGSAHIIQEDYWGNRLLVDDLAPGDLFAEAFSCAREKQLSISVVAATDCKVLLVDLLKIISTCPSACSFHRQLIANLLSILARKNVQLVGRLEDLSRRSTRDKLLSYFSRQALKEGSSHFEIPFNRQQLADYLAVDRSALSAELSRMQKSGILRYQKNNFELLEQ